MSPTPQTAGGRYASIGRRTSARLAHRGGQPAPSQAAAPQYPTVTDSSDDERLSPMKLSAITKALLGGTHISDACSTDVPAAAASAVSRRTSIPSQSSIPGPSRPTSGDQESSWKRAREQAAAPSSRPPTPPSRPASRDGKRRSSIPTPVKAATRDQTSSAQGRRVVRHTRTGSNQSSRNPSPVASRETSPAPRKRVVRLHAPTSANRAHNPSISGTQRSNSLRNSLSSSTRAKRPGSSDGPPKPVSTQSPEGRQPGSSTKTPPVPIRTVRITVGSSGQKSASGNSSDVRPKYSTRSSDRDGRVAPVAAPVPAAAAPQTSMRVKRVAKTPGSFLSGPARRGRQRQSEEDVEGQSEVEAFGVGQEPGSQQPQVRHDEHPASSVERVPDYLDRLERLASGSPVSARDTARAALRRHKSTFMTPVSERKPVQTHLPLVYKIPSPVIPEPTNENKENDAPAELLPAVPASRRAIGTRFNPNGKPPAPIVAEPVEPIPAYAPAIPQILAARPLNTSQRPAPPPPPPPPKMSVAETATTAAGASTTVQASKKKQFLLRVNGKTYTRIDSLGRGGSGKVYRVSAENGKLLALKRVSLENLDDRVIKGYHGEIDLLQRLVGVNRVIQLIDHEFNAEKKMLSLVLEPGELDFNTFLRSRAMEDSRFDPVFIRYWWKEMVECVQSVHERDIIHTDLKPANFVIAQGRLKVIDFGIANAIQTDMTVNVHRDAQIGTPNYMSPESLMDSKEYALTTAYKGQFNAPPLQRPKHFKLGKASDVWSLGCILYQMVYGQCPFAKVAHMAVRVHAIKDWNHPIDFPEHTEDGSRVPPSLIRTMRRCLNRDATERPTCDELLSPTDPFLYPLELAPEVFAAADHGRILPITQELLRDVVWDVAQRVRRGDAVDAEVLKLWPAAYWASCKKSLAMRGMNAAGGEGQQQQQRREV